MEFLYRDLPPFRGTIKFVPALVRSTRVRLLQGWVSAKAGDQQRWDASIQLLFSLRLRGECEYQQLQFAFVLYPERSGSILSLLLFLAQASACAGRQLLLCFLVQRPWICALRQ